MILIRNRNSYQNQKLYSWKKIPFSSSYYLIVIITLYISTPFFHTWILWLCIWELVLWWPFMINFSAKFCHISWKEIFSYDDTLMNLNIFIVCFKTYVYLIKMVIIIDFFQFFFLSIRKKMRCYFNIPIYPKSFIM